MGWRGNAAVLTAAVMWALMTVFIRIFNGDGLFAMEIVEVRALGAAILFFLILFVYDRRKLCVRWRDLWCFFATGTIGVAFFNFCYFKTVERTDIAVAAVLLYTAPVFVMLFSAMLFREKLQKKHWIQAGLAFLGCVLISGVFSQNRNISLTGFLVGVLSGIGYAFYTIFSKVAVQKGYASITIMAYTFLFASVGGAFFTSFEEIGTYVSETGGKGLLFCMMVSLITTVLPNSLYTYGLRYIAGSRAGMFTFADPVAAMIFAFVCFGEKPPLMTLVGVGLILVSLWSNGLGTGACSEDREKSETKI